MVPSTVFVLLHVFVASASASPAMADPSRLELVLAGVPKAVHLLLRGNRPRQQLRSPGVVGRLVEPLAQLLHHVKVSGDIQLNLEPVSPGPADPVSHERTQVRRSPRCTPVREDALEMVDHPSLEARQGGHREGIQLLPSDRYHRRSLLLPALTGTPPGV